ncbi:MAG: ABC transporter ATP-binding protein [Chromatiales bacterium]|nr:ABC transporter ATP-binding protein [Chromatiales bacterium]
MSLLRANGLSVSIAGLEVCRALDLTVTAGSIWAILGRNGVGKTTLLRTLAGLRSIDSGEVLLEEQPLTAWPQREMARKIGVLFQDQGTLFPGTVLETALIGRHPHLERWRWESENDIALAHAALTGVGLSNMDTRQLATLSGGERQRLAIATLLCQEPQLYLLDEPSNHLDPHHQIAVMNTLCRRAHTSKHAAIMVMHDVNLAMRYCDHALLLYGNGETEHGPIAHTLTAANLSRLYTHPMSATNTARGEFFYPE